MCARRRASEISARVILLFDRLAVISPLFVAIHTGDVAPHMDEDTVLKSLSTLSPKTISL